MIAAGVETGFTVDVGALGTVPATAYAAADPTGITFLFAPGAGAPRTHPIKVGMSRLLAARGVDVVTFDFLYATAGRRMPDPAGKLEAAYSAMIGAVRARSPLDALFVGGKSMGGRIASQVVAAMSTPTSAIRGLIFLGYPLSPPGKATSTPKGRPPRAVPERFRHLLGLSLPMFFAQGERDPFGGERELAPLVARLRMRSVLHVVEHGDHSLHVPRRFGVDAEIHAAVADAIVAFCNKAGRRR